MEALKDVSFSLQKGEFAAVVGESGSGKSTMLNCVGGLDTPTSGKIYLDGQDLFAMKESRRTVFRRENIGFIFQSFQLVPELDVEQNIIFPLLLDYQKPDQRKVEELLEVLGLTERRRHLPVSSPEVSSREWRSAARSSCTPCLCSRTNRRETWIPKTAGMCWICL